MNQTRLRIAGPWLLTAAAALASACSSEPGPGVANDAEADAGVPQRTELGLDAELNLSDGGQLLDDVGADAGDVGVDAGMDAGNDAGADAGGEVCELDSDCVMGSHCSGFVGAAGTCRPFPELDSARILVLGAASHWRKAEEVGVQYERPAINLSRVVADTLETALDAAGYAGATVSAFELVGTGSGRLLDFVYSWTERDAHQAKLEENWDFVVFFDNYYSLHTSPELLFEGARVLSKRVRAAGAIPIWVMHSDSRPSPSPSRTLCNNRCAHHNDGACGDVQHLSVGLSAATCAFGTDCSDCGARPVASSPKHETQDLVWRIANGTGSVAVPAGVIASRLDAPYTEWPFIAGAAVFTTLTGENAAELSSQSTPAAVSEARWNQICAEAVKQEARDSGAVHYSDAFVGAARIEAVPVPEPYRFLISGTSSERGFAVAMREMLDRENVPYEDGDTGRCSTRSASVDTTCFLRKVLPAFGGVEYHVLYARNYNVNLAYMLQQSGMPNLMPQLYDRHWDDTQNDGINALDDLFARAYGRYIRASVYEIAWLPQHVNFAKLKARLPSADLLRDGVHATDAVQAGLASMSWTSRTGLLASTTGVDVETAEAIRLGDHSIRTLSTLSRTGALIPDRPDTRRRARPMP